MSPGRLPRAKSQALGGDETLPNTICPSPMVMIFSGLRGVSVKEGGRLGHHLFDEMAIKADILPLDLAASSLEMGKRRLVEKLHPDIGQDPHRAVMDGLHPFGRQGLGRAVDVARHTPWHLVDRMGGATGGIGRTATGTAATGGGVIGHSVYLSGAVTDGLRPKRPQQGANRLPVSDMCRRIFAIGKAARD